MKSKQQKRFNLALLLLLAMSWVAGCSKGYTFHGTLNDPPKPAVAVTGTNWDEKPFHLRDQRGKVVVAFFGYTYCPDVCPLTLANMNEVYQKLGDKVQDVAFVFISTDPARDTPKRLATYIAAFNTHFYGINIPDNDLAAVKQGFGVYSAKNTTAPNQTAENYFVDHTGYVYLIDQQGQWRVTYPYDVPIDEVVADVEHLLAG